MTLNPIFTKITLFWVASLSLFRLLETIGYGLNYDYSTALFQDELLGLGLDCVGLGVCLAIGYSIARLVKKQESTSLYVLSFFIFILYGVFHLGILHYFLYQQTPLDIFVYQYPLQEVTHTVATTDAKYGRLGWAAAILALTTAVFYFGLKNRIISAFFQKVTVYYYIASILLYGLSTYFLDLNSLSKNKSTYFYGRSLAYFFKIGNEHQPYTKTDALNFQAFYKNRTFLSPDYPLLHDFNTTDSLSQYLHSPTAAPNIVVLIMEGLNDDFIHDYRGLNLMPFLRGLAQKSLYWDHCLTMGERSFAAVPCITGGLPYGNKGFNFLDKIPPHLSLTSVLDANGYFTTFFDGQGSWFHNKDRFFKQNNLDLLVDNKKYPPKYNKIIVKDFFWGFHDKDLFQHSLEVIDTLPQTKRLDMYFTGTMHSPYYLADEAIYTQKWNTLCANAKEEDKAFFEKNSVFFKCISFTDDALQDFFRQQAQKPNYENTIFIITGDHPMTELPRANSLKRYHVPMIVYSPMILQPKVFNQRVSHLDVYETLVAYLNAQKVITAPKWSSSIGENLFTRTQTLRPFAFMNDNREIIDFLYGDYYLADNKIYSVQDKYAITEISDRAIKKGLQEKLATFKKTNYYVSNQGKILPDTLFKASLGYATIPIGPIVLPISFESEFQNILSALPIEDREIVIDVMIEHDATVPKDYLLVCETKNEKGERLVWKSEEVKANTTLSQLHFKMPKLKDKKSKSLNLYFWNIDKQNIKVKEIEVRVFGRK